MTVTLPLSRDAVIREAAASGFRVPAVEKVARLMNLLDTINRDPYLRDRFALKGGTALNLFIFNLPRLSVDIDLNYIGSRERSVMLEERKTAELIIVRICEQAGLTIRKQATEHLGGKWILPYRSTSGTADQIEIDLNYGLRDPLWGTVRTSSTTLGSWFSSDVLVLDEHELAAGKLVALLARAATRDLFDAHQLLTTRTLDTERLRLGTVLYGAMNLVDWRTVGPTTVAFTPQDFTNNLLPVLLSSHAEQARTDPTWAERMVERVRGELGRLFPLREPEIEFIRRVRDEGNIAGDLLTSDSGMIDRINQHPMLRWRARQRMHNSANRARRDDT